MCLYLGIIAQLPIQLQLIFPVVGIRLGDGANDLAGIACGYHIGGNIMGYYTACANDGIFTDGHTGAYHGVAADPYIVADGDGQTLIMVIAPYHRVNGVIGGVKRHLWPQHHIVTNGDLTAIEKDTIVITVESP